MVAWAAGFSVLDSVYGAVLAVALWMTSMMTPPKPPGSKRNLMQRSIEGRADPYGHKHGLPLSSRRIRCKRSAVRVCDENPASYDSQTTGPKKIFVGIACGCIRRARLVGILIAFFGKDRHQEDLEVQRK
jgi:hypothetical protein